MWRWVRIAAGITGRGPRERRLRAAVAGRTVLVTGASEGIGAATARRLAAAGATVLLVARTAERLERVRAEIKAAGGRAFVHPADLSSPDAAAALAADLLARHRRIDVVVSNAGRSIRRSVADTAGRFHDIQRTMSLNHLGPVQLLLVLLPAMRVGRRGHIVNVSTAGLSMNTPNWYRRGPGRRLRAAVAGRTVLVTGASEGIGAATARRLAEAGAVVLLVARTASRLEQVRDEIVAGGGVAHVHPADLSVARGGRRAGGGVADAVPPDRCGGQQRRAVDPPWGG